MTLLSEDGVTPTAYCQSLSAQPTFREVRYSLIYRFLLFTLSLIVSQTTFAQLASPIEVGDRVRVTVRQKQIVGTVEQVSTNSLVLVPDGEQESATVDFILASELQVREPRSRWRGAAIGAGAGLLTSAIIAGAFEIGCAQSADCWGGLASILVASRLLPPLLLGGATIGGLLPPGHRWRDVPLRASFGVSQFEGWKPRLVLRLEWR